MHRGAEQLEVWSFVDGVQPPLKTRSRPSKRALYRQAQKRARKFALVAAFLTGVATGVLAGAAYDVESTPTGVQCPPSQTYFVEGGRCIDVISGA